MNSRNYQSDFLGLWRRALGEPSLASLTADVVRGWCIERGLDVRSVEERNVGIFAETRCIVVTTSDGRACLPKEATQGEPAWEQRKAAAERTAALWEKMEWFSPLWVPQVSYQKLLSQVAHCSKERAIELFGYHTSTIYTLPFQAVCVAQLLLAVA